jgi:predicted ABC-type ATPase
MTPKKRFRMFAGPNGSGKSSLYERLRKDAIIHTDIYISADKIEADIRKNKRFVFNAYGVKVSEPEFKTAAGKYGILSKHPNRKGLLEALSIKGGILYIKEKKFIDSYLASAIVSYLGRKFLETGKSFCLETVMSHPSKVALLEQAKRFGFKTYLYFVFTDDPRLNIRRIRSRVESGGHDVKKEKIKPRYERSLGYVADAVKTADVSFLVDNSILFDVVAEIEKGKKIRRKKAGYDFKKKLPAFYKAYKKKLQK